MSSESSPRIPGTWANGRVLKPEERKRKREVDRVAKRLATESAKSSELRIQALEQLVGELSGRVVKLEAEFASIQQRPTLNLDHEQDNVLAGPLSLLPWLPVQSGRSSTPWSNHETHDPTLAPGVYGSSQPLPEAVNSDSCDLQWIDTSGDCSDVDATNSFMPSHVYTPDAPALLARDISANTSNPTLQSLTNSSPDPQLSNAVSWEQTEKFENILRMLYNLRGSNLVDQDHYANESLLIRGVVEGWDFVLETPYGKSCPLWTILSGVDQGLYYNCNAIVRLAHLRKIYRMSMFIIYGTSVPSWLDPNSRPRRYNSPDSLSVQDFIPQPQLRDRLRRTHLTNDFWTWFSHSITFNTVLEFSQAYCISGGYYLFAESFTNDFLQVENWKYSGAMMMHFPTIFGQSLLTVGKQISAGSYEGYTKSGNIVKHTTQSSKKIRDVLVENDIVEIQN